MDSPLEAPRDVYRPFTPAETRVLREFVANVRELAAMRFFKQVPREFTISFGLDNQPAMVEPDNEDVRAAVGLFRQLYRPSEPTSAAVVLNQLKRSAQDHGGPHRKAAINELRDLRRWTREILVAGIGIGIIFDHGDRQQSVSPEEILDAYFHGRYLHSGNDQSDMVRRLDDSTPIGRFTLYNVMRDLTRAYFVIANGVDLILAVPELVDADSKGPPQEAARTPRSP